jgi:threonine/homoserine efflux transporter RhtA
MRLVRAKFLLPSRPQMKQLAAINIALFGVGMCSMSIAWRDSLKVPMDIAGILCFIGFFCLSLVLNLMVLMEETAHSRQ